MSGTAFFPPSFCILSAFQRKIDSFQEKISAFGDRYFFCGTFYTVAGLYMDIKFNCFHFKKGGYDETRKKKLEQFTDVYALV